MTKIFFSSEFLIDGELIQIKVNVPVIDSEAVIDSFIYMDLMSNKYPIIYFMLFTHQILKPHVYCI